MLMQNYVCIAIVSVTWVVVGYTLAFGDGNGLPRRLPVHRPGAHRRSRCPGFDLTIPPLLFMAFQLMFAIITAGPDRRRGRRPDAVRRLHGLHRASGRSSSTRRSAHWAFSPQRLAGQARRCSTSPAAPSSRSTAAPPGSRSRWSSASGSAGRVRRCRRTRCRSRMLGAGLLWFGWFGFNAGSALARRRPGGERPRRDPPVAASAGCSSGSPSSGGKTGSATTLGGASGAIAGLVAITPACGFLEPLPALALGAIAGAVCLSAVQLKYKLGYDDSLDVVAVHFVGGVVGCSSSGSPRRRRPTRRSATRGCSTAAARGCSAGRRSPSLAAGAFAFTVTFLLATGCSTR